MILKSTMNGLHIQIIQWYIIYSPIYGMEH
jgi:hypothetical protein